RGQRAVPGSVRSGSGAAARQVGADQGPVDVSGLLRLGVVRAVDAVRAGEQLVGVLLVEDERHVELRPVVDVDAAEDGLVLEEVAAAVGCGRSAPAARNRDRKSTRLNSSHDQISYAV